MISDVPAYVTPGRIQSYNLYNHGKAHFGSAYNNTTHNMLVKVAENVKIEVTNI